MQRGKFWGEFGETILGEQARYSELGREPGSLGCYGGEAVERETFSRAKLGVLLIFARERLPQV